MSVHEFRDRSLTMSAFIASNGRVIVTTERAGWDYDKSVPEGAYVGSSVHLAPEQFRKYVATLNRALRALDARYIASDGSLWHITHDPPGIPARRFDWAWVADDYDGPPDERCGAAASREACIAEIEALIAAANEARPGSHRRLT